jgi:hypothetical protein
VITPSTELLAAIAAAVAVVVAAVAPPPTPDWLEVLNAALSRYEAGTSGPAASSTAPTATPAAIPALPLAPLSAASAGPAAPSTAPTAAPTVVRAPSVAPRAPATAEPVAPPALAAVRVLPSVAVARTPFVVPAVVDLCLFSYIILQLFGTVRFPPLVRYFCLQYFYSLGTFLISLETSRTSSDNF